MKTKLRVTEGNCIQYSTQVVFISMDYRLGLYIATTLRGEYYYGTHFNTLFMVLSVVLLFIGNHVH